MLTPTLAPRVRPATHVGRRLRLALLAGVTVAGLTTGGSPILNAPTVELSDTGLYRAIVARVRLGEPYHFAVGAELRRRGYATREIFNWRTPLHLRAVAAVPDGFARLMIVALFVAVGAATMSLVRPLGPPATIVTGIWLLGSLLLMSDPAAPFRSEAWAGVLIAASVIAYARGKAGAGVAIGLLALFTRELAAPYCVACTLAALWRRRWPEVTAWGVGAAAYGGYYAWHVSRVLPLRLATDVGHGSSWLEFGGLPFILSTFEKSGWLFMLPAFWHVAALVLVVAGILYTRTPFHARLASLTYLVWFAIVGKVFDHYWGLMATPTWTLVGGIGVEATWQWIRAEVDDQVKS